MSAADYAPLIAARTSFQRALRSWFLANARPLPWRALPSPYKTVVSEFMLQQTQVKTVLPYFARWMDALPDFSALAAAPEERVMKLWEGLGYYSRARNLHRLAKAVIALPALPTTRTEWMELPGVGPYTSAAITSISFNTAAACVDGNVVRILARLVADGTLYRDSGSAAKVLTPLADALLPAKAPGDHNQAMMELGATICFRQNPLCTVCPVYKFCVSGQRGDPENFPRLAPKEFEKVQVQRGWIRQHDSLLLHRAGPTAKRFAGMYELPTFAQLGVEDRDVKADQLLARKKRGITRFQITESIYALSAPREKLLEGLVWIAADELKVITLSGPHRRWVSELLAAGK